MSARRRWSDRDCASRTIADVVSPLLLNSFQKVRRRRRFHHLIRALSLDRSIVRSPTLFLPDDMNNSSSSNVTDLPPGLEPYGLAHLLVTATILSAIILATIVGNVFVIAAIALERNLHNVNNYLITSLAVADILVAALVMPLAAVNEVSRQWFLGTAVCDMWISLDVLCCTASILHLVAIALDRYWAVTRIDYIQNRSARRIVIMIVLSWVLSAFITLPPLFGWKNPKDNASGTGKCIISQDHFYTLYSTAGAFYLPLLFMILIYIKIYKAARQRIRKQKFKPKPFLSKDVTHEDCAATPLETFPSSQNQSPDPSSNGSTNPLSDTNRNVNHVKSNTAEEQSALSAQEPLSKDTRNSFVDINKIYQDIRKNTGGPSSQASSSQQKVEKVKEKLEAKRERKAARTLAIITGTFVSCWLPFFALALFGPFCPHCNIDPILRSIIIWLGYFNSLLNPIIYTVFNPDFRNAFRKILFGQYRGVAQYRGGFHRR